MKIYKEQNVYDAALERIRWCFDEFEDVVVSYSGGKDSTVIFEMALQVAKEKNRLPLKVMWLDQELEWKSTVEQVKSVMYRPEVEPMWYQIPMLILNASSGVKGNTWLHCWYHNEEWAREQDPISIKVNRFGTNRFHDLFGAISKVEFAGKKVCYLGGVRAEESPGRYLSLTATPKYKWVTWGKKNDPKEEHYTMPVVTIYDPEIKKYVIIDGFHRYSTMRRNKDIYELNDGYLPCVVLEKSIEERMASTVRHNRARGKHSVAGMSNIVFEMLKKGVSDADICNELGLEKEELVRLKHITGFAKLFADTEYGKAWESDKMIKIKADYKKEHPQENINV